ncbi:hypothetical protein GCM10027174_27250 [Salinifilum aidingensis]
MCEDGGHGEGAFTAATGRALENDRGKPNYLQYQRDLIGQYCGRTVLEVGAGLGEFAEGFTGRDRYVVTDVDPAAVERMRQRFADRPEVEVGTFDVDGSTPLSEPVASLVSINVLEHIDDDVAALQGLAKSVVQDGTIVLWVPGYQRLYGEFDRKVGHVRRYTPATLSAAVRAAGLHVDLARPVNFLGGFAWWAAVRKGGVAAPNPKLVALYDRCAVPVTRGIERFVRVPFGQSVLCVARVV